MAVVAGAAQADARRLVWARSGDALTLDPHAVNEGPTLTLLHQIYEPLVIRDAQGKTLPGLAERWTPTEDPTLWELKLREGVTFHDGTPMTAEDAVFSLKRAQSATSDMRGLLAGIAGVESNGPYGLRIRTKVTDPLLPIRLSSVFIMSRAWARKHGAQTPSPLAADEASKPPAFQVLNALGTGPFRLVSREPGVETVLARNDRWWGWSRSDNAITEIVYRPLPDPAARIEALRSGTVDFVQDVPVRALAELSKRKDLRINVGPENRAIFLGLNIAKPELSSSNIKGRNPFADHRVRAAMNVGLDRTLIQREVMLGQSLPTAVIAPPGINGYPREIDRLPDPNIEEARRLMQAAGYEGGFAVSLNCTTDRYINDDQICENVARQLATIGIRVSVAAQSKAQHFPLVRSGQADFFLLGWGVPTFDSEYVFWHLYHSHDEKAGSWNGTGYANAAVDQLIMDIAREIDQTKRSQLINQVWNQVQSDLVYLPLHIQTLHYAMRPGIDIPVDISNTPKLAFAAVEPAAPEAPAPAKPQ